MTTDRKLDLNEQLAFIHNASIALHDIFTHLKNGTTPDDVFAEYFDPSPNEGDWVVEAINNTVIDRLKCVIRAR